MQEAVRESHENEVHRLEHGRNIGFFGAGPPGADFPNLLGYEYLPDQSTQ